MPRRGWHNDHEPPDADVPGGGPPGSLLSAAPPRNCRIPLLIEMKGSPRGEMVWFMPLGLAVAPGATIRFVNRDAGNSHTATAYHPDILDRPRRIPARARPWDSGLLLPDQASEVMLTVPGVYDLYCQPHEHAGMVARIVVGRPGQDPDWQDTTAGPGDLPEAALAAFPPVHAILEQGALMPGHGEAP